jgi:hypothetical protein
MAVASRATVSLGAAFGFDGADTSADSQMLTWIVPFNVRYWW